MHCGQINRDGARFCAGCGASLGGAQFLAPRRLPTPAKGVPADTPEQASTPSAAAGYTPAPLPEPIAPVPGSMSAASAAQNARGIAPDITPNRAAANAPSTLDATLPAPQEQHGPAPAATTAAAFLPIASVAAASSAAHSARAPFAALPETAPHGGSHATATDPVPAAAAVPAARPADPQVVPAERVRRETFYRAQRRHRRRARVLSAITVVPVLLLAAFVAALISPWIFLLIAGALRLLRLAGPLHGPARDAAQALNGLLLPLRDYSNNRPVQPASVVRLLLALLAPSVAVLLLTWLWVRLLFRHAGGRGVLARLGGRPPRAHDLLEQRLVDIAAEMALAAGIAPPPVLVLDVDGANAAIIGTSYKECTLVVSRGLLTALNRDETEGVVAALVGSAGNGDLGLARAILSVFQTIGLVLAGRDVLLSGVARRTIWRFLAFSLWRGGGAEKRAARAAALSDLMLRSTTLDGLDTGKNDKNGGLGRLGCITVWPYLASAMFRMFMLFYLNAVTGPLLGWIWRTRRYLADATAVQLTRNPDALAGALSKLALCPTRIAGSGSADHLFVVKPAGSMAIDPKLAAALHERARQVLEQTRGQGAAARLAAFAALQGEVAPLMAQQQAAHAAEIAAAANDASVSDELGMHGLYPPAGKRLKRLQALGAHIAAPAKRPHPAHWLLGYAIIGGLLAIAGALMLVVWAMITAFAVGANTLLALPVLLLVSWLTGGALHS
jgi:Zn-dependent protease with chaperone function